MRVQDVLTSVGGEGADPVVFDGALIRIDPATGAAASGNPLIGGTIAGDDPVIAHGLRNPFRFAIQPVTGEIFIGDPGTNVAEEIDVIPNPSDGVVENFGWPCWEGFNEEPEFMTNVSMCQDLRDGVGTWVVDTQLTAPFFEYGTSSSLAGCPPDAGSSIAGLEFEQNSNYPAAYRDALFFADFTRGCIFAMKTGGGGLPDPSSIELFDSNTAAVDLEAGPGGDIFYVDLVAGTVGRFFSTTANGTPAAFVASDVVAGDAPLTVTFDASGSSDPEGDTLTYQWDFDGDGSFDDTGVAPTNTYVAPGTFLVRLRVTDTLGASNDATLTINASNPPPPVSDTTAPVVVVDVPVKGSVLSSPVTLLGSATDDVGVVRVRLLLRDRDTLMWWDGSGWSSSFAWVDAVLGSPGGLSTGWSFVFDPPSLSSQPYWFEAKAYDVAGNTGRSSAGFTLVR